MSSRGSAGRVSPAIRCCQPYMRIACLQASLYRRKLQSLEYNLNSRPRSKYSSSNSTFLYLFSTGKKSIIFDVLLIANILITLCIYIYIYIYIYIHIIYRFFRINILSAWTYRESECVFPTFSYRFPIFSSLVCIEKTSHTWIHAHRICILCGRNRSMSIFVYGYIYRYIYTLYVSSHNSKSFFLFLLLFARNKTIYSAIHIYS